MFGVDRELLLKKFKTDKEAKMKFAVALCAVLFVSEVFASDSVQKNSSVQKSSVCAGGICRQPRQALSRVRKVERTRRLFSWR